MSGFTFYTVIVLLRALRRELAVENFFHSHIRDFNQHDISKTTLFSVWMIEQKVFLFDNIKELRDAIARPSQDVP